MSLPKPPEPPISVEKADLLHNSRGSRTPKLIPITNENGDKFTAYVARLSAAQLDVYQEEARKTVVTQRRAVMLSHALVNASGSRLFTEPSDLLSLQDMDASIAEKILDEFLAINGLGHSPKG